MAWLQSWEIPHKSIIHRCFAGYFLTVQTENIHDWIFVFFFFQTIQIWWAMYQSQSRSWMLMTMPPILPQTALCLCVKAPRQARLVIASHSFSQCVPITLFRPVSSHLNPWNPCFSYLHFSPVLFSCPIIFSNHLFSYFNSAIQFSHMYEPTHSHVHKYYGYIYNA